MDRSTAKNFRNRKLRLVETRMSELVEIRKESYLKNQSEIDKSIDELVSRICLVVPLNPQALTQTFKHVIESLFYKRPSKNVIGFLNDISCFPPEVIWESVMRYSAYLNGATGRKKNSVQYFMGFVRNQLFKYKEGQENKTESNSSWELPDDL